MRNSFDSLSTRIRARTDDPRILDVTAEYLRTARQVIAKKPTPREFYDEMIRRYPDWVNPGTCGSTRSACLHKPEPLLAAGLLFHCEQHRIPCKCLGLLVTCAYIGHIDLRPEDLDDFGSTFR